MTNPLTVFDIETEPVDELVEKFTKPFDPSSVKLGAMKDEAKIEAKIAKAEEAHFVEAYEKAALNPATSKICAIGLHHENTDEPHLLYGDEEEILWNFWNIFSSFDNHNWGFYSGSNSRSMFDIRHILYRSWTNKVKVPYGVVGWQGQVSRSFVDLAQIVLAGADYVSYLGLDRAADQLGLHGEDVDFAVVKSKADLAKLGVTGKYFSDILKTNKELADIYLTNDLALTRAIANRVI